LTISLDDDFSGTGLAGIANAINTQLTAAGSNTVASVDGSTIVFTSGETGAAATQPSIANVGATLTAAGFAGFATAGGANETQSTAAELTIDGQVITLTGNHGSAADIATELQTKMQAAGLTDYTAAVSGGEIVITNPNAATAVDVSTVNASASAAGFSVNSGVAGSAAAASQSVSFQIDGNTINLTANYGNAAGVAAAIDGQLGGGYVVSESGGAITVARATAGAGSTAIDITGVTQAADQTSLGLAAATTNGTAGSAGTGSNNATFYVDGNAVNLTTDYSTVAGVATEIENQLQAIDPTYTAVEGDGTNGGAAGTIVISKTGMTAVNITGSDYNATQAGIAFASGQAGQASGAITLAGGGAFAINGTEISGTFTNAAALAAEINKSVQGVYADASSGNLVLSSGAEITLSGASATGATGFNTSTVEADAGNLSQIDVSTAAGALTALQRVDSALSSVSSLRSTFGAIQNRFESVIANLSSTSENLSAARSRIQDADFASETAILTRGQILQQAGTAMLAQANSLPNGVMALLRG
jgi:flagellin